MPQIASQPSRTWYVYGMYFFRPPKRAHVLFVMHAVNDWPAPRNIRL